VNRFDVAVMGAGPAGCAAALALARTGAQVVMVDRPRTTEGRGETLPPEICLPLRKLGVWERFREDGHMRTPGLQIAWGTAVPYHNDLTFNPYGNGWQVDRCRFDRALVAAAATAGVTIHQCGRTRAQRSAAGVWRFTGTECGQGFTAEADFAVDATGRAAWLARGLGRRRVVQDHLVGITATLQSPAIAAMADGRTLIEACPQGWWYSAKIDRNRCVAAFMTDAGQTAATGGPHALWRARLRSAPLTRDRLDGLDAPDPVIRIITASTSRLRRPLGTNWAAIGDAASTMDPLSGRGVQNALTEGIAVAEALAHDGPERCSLLATQAADALLRFIHDRQAQRAHYRREKRWPDEPFWACRNIHRYNESTPTQEES
jgi:flavin-dependent dehydrogenase